MHLDTEVQLTKIKGFRDIVESPLWQYWISTLKERLEGLKGVLVRGTLTAEQIWEHRGRIQELELIVNLPESLLKKEEYLQQLHKKEQISNARR